MPMAACSAVPVSLAAVGDAGEFTFGRAWICPESGVDPDDDLVTVGRIGPGLHRFGSDFFGGLVQTKKVPLSALIHSC